MNLVFPSLNFLFKFKYDGCNLILLKRDRRWGFELFVAFYKLQEFSLGSAKLIMFLKTAQMKLLFISRQLQNLDKNNSTQNHVFLINFCVA